jgi:uncharacterized protein YndB with AHSA1/START domain
MLYGVIGVITIVALTGALLAFVLTRPDTFRVQRTTVIEAPPERIFPFIEDFRKHALWSPYEQFDPSMSRSYSGSKRGKGAVYEWDGKGKVGKGRMEIAHTSPPLMAVIRLDFVRPFRTQNIVEFTLRPEGSSTNVSWAMRGANPLIAKVLQLVSNMDRVVGKDFETGLANLKALAEEQEPGALPCLACTG